MDGGGGAVTLNAFRNPLGSLIVLLIPSAFAGPDGMPLIADIPAPAEPAFGVPTALWANEEADIPKITISARASLIEALNMENSLCPVAEMHEANMGRLSRCATKFGFRR
jgi:hypothetical protein